MLGSYKNSGERLFLQKGASGDISVPCSELSQHQIDGVRFLFTQNKKEKSGVILNFPPGCGSSVLTAVYISAICDKLKRPVLILYDDEKERERWLERFHKFTSIGGDALEVDNSNPYLRKQVFINSITDIPTLHRRHWGMVIVKSDEFISILQKCHLKVDFKIWITAQDLKKDSRLLRFVYNWIYHLDPLVQQFFDQKPLDLFGEDVPNEMYLGMLLEEILFTRTHLKPFGLLKRKHDSEVQTQPIVSKKNKDATGKKIKRSKKPPEVASTSTVSNENTNSLQTPNDDNTSGPLDVGLKKSDNLPTSSTLVKADDEASKMDVESFIRDNDPLVSSQPSDDGNASFPLGNLDNTPQPSEPNSPKAEELCTENSLDFTIAVADIVKNENDKSTDECKDSLSINVGLAKTNVGSLTPDLTPDLTPTEELDVPIIFNVNDEEKHLAADLENPEVNEDKTDQGPSDEKKNGGEDQKSNLDVSTNAMKETESSFDSRMRELEERALRKFKGSVLDNIF